MISDSRVISFSDLQSADLYIDAIYQGGRSGNAGDDPFPKLLSVSNQGGFRYRGSLSSFGLLVLTSSMNDPYWPDSLDRETGTFTYFGDNKRPGHALHDTPRKGNLVLKTIFESAHGGKEGRKKVPPILIFSNTGEWRDVRFLGLAIPGAGEQPSSEDLVALWRTAEGMRFQNYRAYFSILNAAVISRAWISDIIVGKNNSPFAPEAWTRWVETGTRNILKSQRSLEYRTKQEQLPASQTDEEILKTIHSTFSDRPHDFEKCAAAIARLMLADIAEMDLTRPSRDGGRDAVGKLRLGQGTASILVDFALEAKCYDPKNAVGVREMSRLISRLRHRQFGILITTSYVDTQAYKEIKEDRHPIIVIAGIDIVTLLKSSGYAEINTLKSWLDTEFPPA